MRSDHRIPVFRSREPGCPSRLAAYSTAAMGLTAREVTGSPFLSSECFCGEFHLTRLKARASVGAPQTKALAFAGEENFA